MLADPPLGTQRATGRKRARMFRFEGACHLLTRAGQVIGVQQARRALPRRAVMLAFTIPAVAASAAE